jgi:hypothetical protein
MTSNATTPSALAQRTFFLLSAPTFTLISHLLEGFQSHLQLKRSILRSERDVIDDEKHLGPFQAIQELRDGLIVTLN